MRSLHRPQRPALEGPSGPRQLADRGPIRGSRTLDLRHLRRLQQTPPRPQHLPHQDRDQERPERVPRVRGAGLQIHRQRPQPLARPALPLPEHRREHLQEVQGAGHLQQDVEQDQGQRDQGPARDQGADRTQQALHLRHLAGRSLGRALLHRPPARQRVRLHQGGHLRLPQSGQQAMGQALRRPDQRRVQEVPHQGRPHHRAARVPHLLLRLQARRHQDRVQQEEADLHPGQGSRRPRPLRQGDGDLRQHRGHGRGHQEHQGRGGAHRPHLRVPQDPRLLPHHQREEGHRMINIQNSWLLVVQSCWVESSCC